MKVRNVHSSGWQPDHDKSGKPCQKFWLNWEVEQNDGDESFWTQCSCVWSKNEKGQIGPFSGKRLGVRPKTFKKSMSLAEGIFKAMLAEKKPS